MKALLNAILLLVILSAAHPMKAGQYVAFVVGNSNYGVDGLDLKNPSNDAKLMASSLERLGFKVTLRLDQDLGGMEDGLREFRKNLQAGDLAWFYFAGHGIQKDKQNYLIPVKADVKEAFELRRKALDVESVLAAMDESGAKMKVVVLDCCRNNPLARSFSRSLGTRGLAQPESRTIPSGTLIAYSTADNDVADDGEGVNSLYTQSLASVLDSRPTAGLELKTVFFDASKVVKQVLGQSPFLYVDAGSDDLFLVDPSSVSTNTGEALSPESSTLPPAPGLAGTTPVVAGQMVILPDGRQAFIPVTQPAPAIVPPPVAISGNLEDKIPSLEKLFSQSSYSGYNEYSKSKVLEKVQKVLKDAGLYSGKLDGDIGPGTFGALRIWQGSQGVSPSGLVDQLTLEKMMLVGLAEQVPPKVTVSRAYNGRRVEAPTSSRPATGVGDFFKKSIIEGVGGGIRRRIEKTIGGD
jgi:hypothetical protein